VRPGVRTGDFPLGWCRGERSSSATQRRAPSIRRSEILTKVTRRSSCHTFGSEPRAHELRRQPDGISAEHNGQRTSRRYRRAFDPQEHSTFRLVPRLRDRIPKSPCFLSEASQARWNDARSSRLRFDPDDRSRDLARRPPSHARRWTRPSFHSGLASFPQSSRGRSAAMEFSVSGSDRAI